MKALIITFILILTLASCAQKESKGKFKLMLGKTSSPLVFDGGAYIETYDLVTKVKTIIPLDNEQSAEVPFGTYNILLVAFEGPTLHAGKVYCGSLKNIALTTQAATVNAYLDEAECGLGNHTEILNKLVGPSNDLWDSAIFDTAKWGP